MAENTRSPIENVMDGHLKGLILPQEQTAKEPNQWLIVLAILLILLLLVALWRWNKYRNSPKQIARRKIAQLRGFIAKSQQRQDIAIQLSSTLRKGLQVTRLELYQPSEKQKWQYFLSSLENASYSQTPPTVKDMEMLFTQSDNWLK